MAERTAAARVDTAQTAGTGTEAPPRRRRFTVDEYHRMAEIGILHEDDHVELLDGELIQMAAIGSYHADCVDFLARWFIRRLDNRATVRIQNPVCLDGGSEPEPDLVLLPPRRYADAHPGPEDVFLLVEVSHTTLHYDRDAKLPRYAAAGIPEAWLVDLEGERVLVYRGPTATDYQQMQIVARGGTLSPEAFPDLSLAVDELLG